MVLMLGGASMASASPANSVNGWLTRLLLGRPNSNPVSSTTRLITQQVSGAFMLSDRFEFSREDMSTSITWDFVIRRRSTTRGLVASSVRQSGHDCGAARSIGTITRSIRFSGVVLDLMTLGHGPSLQKPVTDWT